MPTLKERRLVLDSKFKQIPGVHVYFQPPASVMMQYPAIRYVLADVGIIHADDVPYIKNLRFTATVIDKDPDSAVAEALSNFKGCSYNRTYSADNLNHFVFDITI